MDCDTKRIGGDTRNRVEVFERVVEGAALEQGLVNVRLGAAQQNRVAIRASASDGGSTERRATPANVFNHHGSDEGLHLVRPWATDKVECAARRKRHD